MSNATFKNFSNEPFTGYWNGKPKTFKPGEKQYMPSWLAEHFATHLANRELIKAGNESYVSPKKPADVPQFMEAFNKAYFPDGAADGGSEIDGIIASASVDEPSMDIAVKKPEPINHGPAAAQAAQRDEYVPTDHEVGPGNTPTVIGSPDADEEEYDLDQAEPPKPVAPVVGLQ